MKYQDLYPEENQPKPVEKEPFSLNKPYLITRYGEAILDAIVFIALTVGLFFAGKALFYGPFGYDSALSSMHTTLEESGLYKQINGGYFELYYNENYDTSKTPEANLENPILYYYTNHDYPRSQNKAKDYIDSKGNSDYYVRIADGEYDLPQGSTVEQIQTWVEAHFKRAENVPEATIKTYLIEQFNTASYFVQHGADYVANVNHCFYVTYFVVLIAEAVAWALYYLLIPMVTPKRQTLFKVIFRMALADRHTDLPPIRIKVALRQLTLFLLCILFPTTWYMLIGSAIGYLALLFPIVEIIMMGFGISNRALHDIVGGTYVVSTVISPNDLIKEQQNQQ